MKENKFVMGEEEDKAPTVHKKPTRHHVKRRSSGRVHVAKLAPMARANAAHTDSEAELLDDTVERPTMRRSQSQRSLHRLSFDRKGFAVITPRKKPIEKPEEHIRSTNPASLTHRVIAEPIEQTLNATAHNLVVPTKKAVYPNVSSDTVKKPLLKSQFIIVSEDPVTYPSRSMSRTQQKLMLQRQQVQDTSSPVHPRNMQKINKELETLSREYKCIKRYQDPLRDSLVRCLQSLMVKPNKLQHSTSSSVIPVIAAAVVANNHHHTPKPFVPHMEQRQIAHRHHHLKSIALSRYHQLSSSADSDTHDKHVLGFSWNATTAFLDRMFNK